MIRTVERKAAESKPAESKPAETINDVVVRVLNKAFAVDPAAMHAMLCNRIPCNQAMADDPTIVVMPSVVGGYTLGLMGIVNGMLGELAQPLASACYADEIDPDGSHWLLGFCRYLSSPGDQAGDAVKSKPAGAIAEAAFRVLDRALAADAAAGHALRCNRIPCSKALAENSWIAVEYDPISGHSMSVIGVINGLLIALGQTVLTLRFGTKPRPGEVALKGDEPADTTTEDPR